MKNSNIFVLKQSDLINKLLKMEGKTEEACYGKVQKLVQGGMCYAYVLYLFFLYKQMGKLLFKKDLNNYNTAAKIAFFQHMHANGKYLPESETLYQKGNPSLFSINFIKQMMPNTSFEYMKTPWETDSLHVYLEKQLEKAERPDLVFFQIEKFSFENKDCDWTNVVSAATHALGIIVDKANNLYIFIEPNCGMIYFDTFKDLVAFIKNIETGAASQLPNGEKYTALQSGQKMGDYYFKYFIQAYQFAAVNAVEMDNTLSDEENSGLRARL